jgi:type III secretory pathway component EscU
MRELCQFRIPKCHDCKDIKASQDEIKVKMKEWNGETRFS